MQRGVEKYFGDNKPYAGLGRASLHSGVALLAVRGINVIVQLASTVLLARLLSPHDFGLVAMVVALAGFVPMLMDLGTTDATIQRPSITHEETSTLFWLNLAIGGVLTVLFVGCAELIATLFREPDLAGIAVVSSLTFLLTAGSIQHYALMRRAMEFRRVAVIELAANVIATVVAIAMAFTGWGYWSLALKPVLTSGLIAVGAWVSCPWLPGRPRLSSNVKEMVRFGLGITGFTLTDYVTRSADRLVIGYIYGAGPLGYFQNAFLLYSNVLTLLTEPLHNVAVSSLSKLKDNIDELKRAWAVALSSLSFLYAGVFAVLAVTGQDFVVILLGEKWAPAGVLLCIFAVRGIANSVERTLGWLHVVAGRTDRWMKWGVFSAACQLAALLAGLPFGLIGVVVAYAIAMFCLFVPALVYAGRPLGIGVRDVLSAAGPQTAAGVSAAVLGFTLQQLFLLDLNHIIRFVISAAISLAIYLAVVVGIFNVREPLRLAWSVLRDLRSRRSREGA